MSGNKDLEGLGACQASPDTACSSLRDGADKSSPPSGFRPTGAWRFDDDGEVREYLADDEFGDECIDNIAVVYGEQWGGLIAAAPDLYEALREMVMAAEGAGLDARSRRKRALAQGLAALSKAEGR